MTGRAPVKTAIIGYGMAARVFHAPLIQACADLSLVAVSTSRSDGVAADIAVRPVEALLDDGEVQLIVVATPNDTHFEIAQAALGAGKHVVVDKPFTVFSRDADALAAQAHAEARLLSVFHNRRWDSDFLTVRALLASGRLGDVELFEAHWDRFRPDVASRWREEPRPGAGLLYDLGPHLIDQALQLFGWPDELSARVAVERPGAAVDDCFELTLHYGPRRALLAASSLMREPRPRFAVRGTDGRFVKRGLDPQEEQLKAGMRPRAPGFGVEPSGSFGMLTLADGTTTRVPSERGRYVAYYEAIARAIRDGSPPPVTAGDAAGVIRLIELAFESSATGRRLRADRARS